MSKVVVAREEEFEETDRKIVEVDGDSVGVFQVDGEYYAYKNYCPHQGAHVCEGKLTGTKEANFDRDRLEIEMEWVEEGRILNCPRHAWEFDVTTGESLSRSNAFLIPYPVEVEDGDLVISLK